jgi:molecular chaperone DnaK (HSP70)
MAKADAVFVKGKESNKEINPDEAVAYGIAVQVCWVAAGVWVG